MPGFYEIPLRAINQEFAVSLNGVPYRMRVIYRDTRSDVVEQGWTLDILLPDQTPIVCGLPLVPTIDLLDQYSYLLIGGGNCGLFCFTDGAVESVPTFANLGVGSHLYLVVVP